MHQNVRDPNLDDSATRKPWQPPRMNKIDAYAAELTVGVSGDAGVDLS